MKLRICLLSKLQHVVESNNTQFKEPQVTYYKYLVDLSICYKLPQISVFYWLCLPLTVPSALRFRCIIVLQCIWWDFCFWRLSRLCFFKIIMVVYIHQSVFFITYSNTAGTDLLINSFINKLLCFSWADWREIETNTTSRHFVMKL